MLLSMYMLVTLIEKKNRTPEILNMTISGDKEKLREKMRLTVMYGISREEDFYTKKLPLCKDRKGLEREVKRRIMRCREDAADIEGIRFQQRGCLSLRR